MVEGPVWSAKAEAPRAGRYPLAAERHVVAQVDRLLPGVTTVTPHGRYFAVHAMLAQHFRDAGVTVVAEQQDLLRRVEVALAAVSSLHEKAESHAGLTRAHGADKVAPAARAGSVDVPGLSAPGPSGYAQGVWGYWPQYKAAEIMTGGIAVDRFAPGPTWAPVVRDALAGLLDLAAAGSLDHSMLTAAEPLCVCGGMTAPDGEWLARLLVASADVPERALAASRRQSVLLLTRILDLVPIAAVTEDLSAAVCYGRLLEDEPTLREFPVAWGWRGVFLRAESANAWRRLWSWLVGQISGATPRAVLAGTFADAFDDVTVRQFRDGLPALRAADGSLAPAEREAQQAGSPVPVRALAVLAVGAARARDLDGVTLVGFHGRDPSEVGQELGPQWLAQRLDEWADRSIRDFVRSLTQVMLDRSQRIALRKARRDPKTQQWMIKSRVIVRDGGLVFKNSDEGDAPIGLRWDQLATVLAETGAIQFDGARWAVTDRGRDVLV